MEQLPREVEVEPGQFKLLEECTDDEIRSLINRLADASSRASQEASEAHAAHGLTPEVGDLMDHGQQKLAEAKALRAYLHERAGA